VSEADSAADSEVDEEGEEAVAAGAGVSVLQIREGSATSEIPVNFLTSQLVPVVVVVVGMVRAKAKDMVVLTVDEEVEDTVAVEVAAAAMLVELLLAEEAEAMVAVLHPRRVILRTVANRAAVPPMDSREVVPPMDSREVVDIVSNRRQLVGTRNKDLLDSKVDTDNRVELRHHTAVNREEPAVDHMANRREVLRTVMDKGERQLQHPIRNKAVVHQVDIITSRELGEAEVMVSNQLPATLHLQQAPGDMDNNPIADEVAMGSSSSHHQLRRTATGAQEATPNLSSTDKLFQSKVFSSRYHRIEHMTNHSFQQLLHNYRKRDSAMAFLPYQPLFRTK